ncbi:MAG: ubiquitin-like small modifier protein 1 [Capsulimonas sp.]|jgi:molybdopterin synthase sulfur carrier subunit|uniref:ubiquitin-like small modifier protein 1 n=1 Tax=Capsulimonas sp. TaxID=2494211 RepID=UPI003264F9A4|nr:molybdopterin synthase subunit MoaD [Capsulimonas sp.]
MAVSVLIPTPLRGLTANQDTVETQEGTIAELIQSLESEYPGMGNRLSSEDGVLRRFINIYVNGEDIRFLQGADTPVKNGDEVSIVPAIAGGKDC